MIETGGSGRLWLLSGPGSSYALHLTERDELLHLHWGRRIGLGDAEALAAEPPCAQRPFGPAPAPRAEFPVGGAPEPLPAALTVRPRHPGGAEWCFEEYEIAAPADGSGQELRLHFHDSHHHLDLTLHYRMRRGSDVVERWTTATHVAGGPGGRLELLRADAACWTLPYRDDWRMSRLHGRWGAESQLARSPLPPGDQLLGGGSGSAGQRHLPWFALDAGDAGEEHGEVWTAALAWSGPWRIALSRLPDGLVRATGGAGGGGAAPVELEPGASCTSPVFAGLWTDGGFGAASRAWHAHQLDHVVPGAWRLRPVACYGGARGTRGGGTDRGTPGGPGEDAVDAVDAVDPVDAADGADGEGAYDPYDSPRRGVLGQAELARRAAGMGVELYVVDDGPPGARLCDRAAPGDADPAAGDSPDGLKPLSDEVHALGMRFGVRIAPETVSPDADLARVRPEWLVRPAGGDGQGGRLLLDLARADVRDHLAAAIGALLHSAPVDHLVWDLDRHPADGDGEEERSPGTGAGPGARTAGLYALIDRVRAEHPGLTVESCASGTRVDLGMLARTDRLGTSDNTDPLDRLAVQHGFGQLHPARVMATLVTGGPAPGLNHRRSSLRFRFVSAMAGALGIGADLLELGPEERAEAASWIALYQQVRPVVQFGELYRLRPPGSGGLTAVQYVRGPETAVLAWLPAQGFGAPVPPLRLRGLDRDACYRDVTTGVVQRGAVLAERGLRTTLSGDLDAAVFHLRRV
ncbi:alpha-galactosidase [Streptomyces sp. NRRL F-5123]|uniref:alpha-galactosidase n=1 Tax=Streptomyces sp. NRRL F-5123 TaxID=1463856 RepID=UPI0004E226C2|nr:alpha-galactosidase [Streptomyces sp. NRRL F-5123]